MHVILYTCKQTHIYIFFSFPVFNLAWNFWSFLLWIIPTIMTLRVFSDRHRHGAKAGVFWQSPNQELSVHLQFTHLHKHTEVNTVPPPIPRGKLTETERDSCDWNWNRWNRRGMSSSSYKGAATDRPTEGCSLAILRGPRPGWFCLLLLVLWGLCCHTGAPSAPLLRRLWEGEQRVQFLICRSEGESLLWPLGLHQWPKMVSTVFSWPVPQECCRNPVLNQRENALHWGVGWQLFIMLVGWWDRVQIPPAPAQSETETHNFCKQDIQKLISGYWLHESSPMLSGRFFLSRFTWKHLFIISQKHSEREGFWVEKVELNVSEI